VNGMKFNTVKPIVEDLVNLYGKESISILIDEELSMLDAARLRESFEIDGPKLRDLEHFRDKILMKKRVSQGGVKIPRYLPFDLEAYNLNPQAYLEDVASYLHFPLFAKPIDNAGCEGTCKILNSVELEKWALVHKESEGFELDEFIEGTLYHYDSLVQDGEIVFSSGGEYIVPGYDFVLGKSSGSIILTPTHPHYEKILQFNKDVFSALKPPNGGTHLEFFITEVGEIVFVEIAARTPGGLVPNCYLKTHGVHLQEAALKLQMHDDPIISKNIAPPQVSWITFPIIRGTVQALIEPSLQSSDYEIMWEVKEGDEILDPEHVHHCLANILLWNDDSTGLKEDVDYIRANPPYLIVEPEEEGALKLEDSLLSI